LRDTPAVVIKKTTHFSCGLKRRALLSCDPMNPTDRTKLHGAYRPPRCKVGGYLRCAIRGRVQVRGIREAPIQWPFTLRENGGGRPMLILCGDLARAVRRESETAICRWWGVSAQTDLRWGRPPG
jgi:hypothetical protein